MNKKYTIQFLECYERHPCLWNPREHDYKNNHARIAALQSIIREIGLPISVEELKIKIKNIRTTYNREASKVAKSRMTGGEIYTPQLIWFSVADRFLRSVIEGRNNYDSMAKDKDSPLETNETSYFEDLEQELTEPAQKKKKTSPKIKAERAQTMYTSTTDPLSIQTNTVEMPGQSRQDEFDTFGQHVASQLRNLPLANAIICQNFISNYLSQERLQVLNEQDIKGSRHTSSNSD